MRICAFLGVALLSLASPAFAQAPGVTDSEVVLGISAPLSGPAAAWGSISMAAEAWAKHVNAQGGVNGRKLRVVIKDDAYNPGQAVANVNEMKDSVFALVLLLGTAVLNANKETVAESGIPTVWPLGNPQVFAAQPKEKIRGVFMAYPDYTDEAQFLVAQAVKLEKAKKIAVFFQNDDYGKGGLGGARGRSRDRHPPAGGAEAEGQGRLRAHRRHRHGRDRGGAEARGPRPDPREVHRGAGVDQGLPARRPHRAHQLDPLAPARAQHGAPDAGEEGGGHVVHPGERLADVPAT